jgi:hypothetical protein
MFRNVVESIGPESGALFVAGTFKLPANDAGIKSRRDARTMPVTTDTTAIRIP